MEDDRWTRVKTVFLEALAHPEPERLEFVAETCSADSAVRDEVLALLSCDRDAGSFCESPAALLLGLEEPGTICPPPRLTPGTRLGPYEVEEFLRAGGMGEVYRGRHTVLDRQVAIKTVSSVADVGARRSLLREARHAALLNHRNVCTIHEVGEVERVPFIVMELVDGRPLSEILRAGRPPLHTALRYAQEVSEALAHAHERGIVHRDLKSSNVMVDGSDHAVVLDFGLAKRLPSHVGQSGGDSVTGAGVLAGTLSHMAPELLLGGTADVRSDVWSLGVVLFELATGELPFRGRTPFDTSAAILEEEPAWPDERVPLGLRLVVERCLAKDPERRYQTVSEVRDVLDLLRRRRTWFFAGRLLLASRRRGLYRWAAALLVVMVAAVAGPRLLGPVGGAEGPALTSLAVLPLENSTADPRLDYYATGLTDALLSSLGAALDVRVVSHAGTRPSGWLAQAATAGGPGVNAVLSGSLRVASNRVVLDVRLLDSTGRVLWTDTFERAPQQVLVLQADVLRGLSAAVRLTTRPGATERLATVRSVSPDAYQAYLKGRYEWNQRTPESLERAFDHFSQAVELDPTYAPAHAALADIYSQFATVLVAKGSPLQYRPEAEAAAIRALQIDPFSAEAYAALGYVQHYDLRWEESERSFRRAIGLNPSYALAHLWYGNLLMSRGRLDEALEHAEMARDLDPFSLIVNANIGWILLAAGRAEEALKHLRWTVALDSTYVQARVRLVGALEQLGRLEEARHEAERLVELSHRSPHMVAMLAVLEVETGRAPEARRLLTELLDRAERGYVPPASIEQVFTALGEVESAVEWLVRAFEERSNAVAYFTLRPDLGGVHADPRIQALAAARGSS